MPSSISDLSSEGGISLKAKLVSNPKIKHTDENSFANALVSYFQNTTSASQPQPIQMTVTFSDIRAACQSAQRRIMRLQQATNTQVGLTSAIREGWFDELRHVAQCFITAQQASAKIEQAINTERAQLQGALSAALNERDVTKSERDSAQQEVQFLRSRLAESLNRTSENQHSSNSWTSTAFDKSSSRQASESQDGRESWLSRAVSRDSSNDSSLHDSSLNDTSDILQRLPTKVEDMPFSPERKPKSVSYNNDGNTYRSDTPENKQQYKAVVQRGCGLNDQTKFFGRDFGSVAQRSKYGRIAVKTPDFSGAAAELRQNNNSTNGHDAGARFSRTPFFSQGPFAPPSQQHPQQLQQQSQHLSHSFRSQRDTRSRPNTPLLGPNMGLLQAIGSRQVQKELSQKTHVQVQSRRALPSPDVQAPPKQGSARAPCMELALVQSRHEPFNKYAPGVAPVNTSDEERIREIFQFFNKTTDWVTRHCRVADKKLLSDMKRLFPQLWEAACSATYPDNELNAGSHSMFMLSSDEFRKYFLTRLLIQYVVRQMWSAEAWEGLDQELTDVLVSVKNRLNPKYGYDAILQPHERHALVEKRSRAIYDFMRRPSWRRIKAQTLKAALTQFKDIVGPMMSSEDADHHGALHELAGISERALRLSAILNTSRLSFQFIFNECGIKFSDQSHRPLNASLPARELQAHHWRLMCVVTPGITYRDDAGVGVDPRFLAKANVLLMQ